VKLAEQEARDMVGEGREPENPVVETEKGERLTRETFKDGTYGWRLATGWLTDYEQDRCEEAYEMGFNKGRGRGAFEAARAAYGGRNA